jgi:uncharacterized protein (DUF885 family)
MTPTDDASTWLDRFFASYYAHRPVNATFIGVHEYDHRLPDLSEHGVGDVMADMEALLKESERIDAALLDPVAAIDLRLARGSLSIQLAEHASRHFHRGNPSLYTGEAVFGVMSLFLTDFAPLPQRTEAAVERLRAIPELLAQGRANIQRAPIAWTERALRECTGALAFLGRGVDMLSDEVSGVAPKAAPRLRAAANRAAVAFSDYAAWLETDLARLPDGDVGCGEEMLDVYLRHGHFVERDAAEILAYARVELERATARLAEGATALGAETPAQALASLGSVHPTADRYYHRYQEIWDQVRALAEKQALLTWPDLPIRYVPRPAWAREAAPYLYFLSYRSPAAFGGPPVHDYLVPPVEEDMPAEVQQAVLEANDDRVIRVNHVIHHGGIGHHAQNWHALAATSRVGRVAAVDCASRIAMFCGGTMAEGWACYATDLVRELGGLTPMEEYAELQARVRMCARAVVDLEVHTGHMTLEDSVQLYREAAGMSLDAAHAEATKNSMFPGTGLMYLLGTDGIHALRSLVRAREGSAFTFKGFHDRLLACGSIPVTLAGKLVVELRSA